MFTNRYTFIYSSIMVIIVASALSFAAIQLKPIQENNIRLEKMQNILKSFHISSDVKDAEKKFKKYITGAFVVNNKGDSIGGINAFEINLYFELKKEPEMRSWPVFIATKENREKAYIVPLRGKGLWGPIWGYLAVKDDFNTVEGAMLDHKGETPGLGAEINSDNFLKQFDGKKLFDESGNFKGLAVKKGKNAKYDSHIVDAISGGTITSNGVSEMLNNCLSEYKAFFLKNR
ncbi:MAG: NADH:ubiquinone reductase (Na(+)-transporting) subunit C [Bacteroidia bacterium]|nr:NADH:ubiquinone reductase (Na(+)-transporting) subunit C [Bacteroidia bacterium]